jgi:glycerol uptake facilitator-like aquaporin
MISFNKEIRVFVEFIGTFLLVLLGTGAIMLNEISKGAGTHLGVSLVFGATVFAMIYLFGKISGAHINPAVSIGLWLTGKLEPPCLKSYIFAQLTGAVTASLLIALVFSSNQNLGATLPSAGIIQSFLFEFFCHVCFGSAYLNR